MKQLSIIFLFALLLLAPITFAVDSSSTAACVLDSLRCSPEFNAYDKCIDYNNVATWVLKDYCAEDQGCYDGNCFEKQCELGAIRCTPTSSGLAAGTDICKFYDNKIQWLQYNYCEQGYVCSNATCVTDPNAPQRVTKEIKCIFQDSSTTQKCYVSTGEYCSGTNECAMKITGEKGARVDIKSSCGDSVQVVLDSVGQTITFYCPLRTSEEVKCVFEGSTTTQSCSAYDSYGTRVSCSGEESCVATVKGDKGATITWKSSCGGYAYTTIDGESEYASFRCNAEETKGVPLCSALGTKSEGWYDSSSGSLLSWANCKNCYAKCSSENGLAYWYNSCTGEFISKKEGSCPSCTSEGSTMAVYPGNECCSGLHAIPTTSTSTNYQVTTTSTTSITSSSAYPTVSNIGITGGFTYYTSSNTSVSGVASPATTPTAATTIAVPRIEECQALVGASVCSQCGNGNCEPWENSCNCKADCISTPVKVRESAKCLFYNTDSPQKCYSDKGYCVAWPTKCSVPISSTSIQTKTIVIDDSKESTEVLELYTQNEDLTEVKCAEEEYTVCAVYDYEGDKGEKVEWMSTCGGYGTTLIDG
ncbi:MAG: hypothetical protein AABW59_05530 [archaeon]